MIHIHLHDLFEKITKEIQIGKIITIKVYGNSMYPTIKSNTTVKVIKLDFNDYKINDIIIFRCDNMIIAHRIVYLDREWVTTKGDNVLLCDNKIKRSDILGKVLL